MELEKGALQKSTILPFLSFERVGHLNVLPLLDQLEKNQHLWKEITARQTTPGSPHRDTECIFLRWPQDLSVHAVFNDLTAIDFHAFETLSAAKPIVHQVLKNVKASKLGRVIITKLKPNGFIDLHTDEGTYADHFERFHVVLSSKSGNRFFIKNSAVGGEFADMQMGEVWWFNHKLEHFVVNLSEEDRIHMIVDCVAPDYRREREA